jgi:hypothetical protein
MQNPGISASTEVRPPNIVGFSYSARIIDGSLSAHFAHTLAITEGAPILLTAA